MGGTGKVVDSGAAVEAWGAAEVVGAAQGAARGMVEVSEAADNGVTRGRVV
jgi:hypothetical protein